MKHIRRAIALSGLLILLTFGSALFVSALGQSDRQNIINIPFNFTVGEKSFSAGKYVIERNRKDSDIVWVIKSKDNADKAMFLTRPVRANDTQEATRLVFRRYDSLYLLSEFWTAGSNTGREIQVTSRERALEKALAEKRQDVILTDGGR